MELLGDHILRGNRITLDGTGASFAREIDCGTGHRAADPTLAKAGPGEEACHRPDTGIGPLLRPTLPGNPENAHEACELRTRFDRTPAHGLIIEVRNETAGRVRVWIATVGLLTQSKGPLVDGK
jgi:hypothetical protein